MDEAISFTSRTTCALLILRDVSLFVLTSYVGYQLYHRIYLKRYRLVGKVSQLLVYPIVSCAPAQTSLVYIDPEQGLTSLGIVDKGFVVCSETRYPNRFAPYGQYRQITNDDLSDMIVELRGKQAIMVKKNDAMPISFEVANPEDPRFKRKQISCGNNVYTAISMDLRMHKWMNRNIVSKNDVFLLQRVKCIWGPSNSRTDIGRISIMNPDTTLTVLPKIAELTGYYEQQLKTCVRALRPNIILIGCRPYNENRWSRIRIGREVFCNVTKPDVRVLAENDTHTHIDHIRDNGEKEERQGIGFECGLKSCQELGVDIQVVKGGEISSGDLVYAVYKPGKSPTEVVSNLYQDWKALTRRATFDGKSRADSSSAGQSSSEYSSIGSSIMAQVQALSQTYGQGVAPRPRR